MHRSKLLYLLIPLVIGILLLFLSAQSIPQAAQSSSHITIITPAEKKKIEIEIGADQERWRIDTVIKATELVTSFDIAPIGVFYPGEDDNAREFVKSAEVGQGSDIVYMGRRNLRVWAQAGYINPFNSCQATFSEFQDVLNSAWRAVTWRGQIWGVPQMAHIRPLYFNKVKLREMGWTEEEVAALPEKIKKGQYTLNDMLATAREAITQGVIEPGFGYWYRPVQDSEFIEPYLAYGGQLYNPIKDKLVIERDALERWYAFQARLIEEGITPANLLDHTWNTSVVGRSIYHDTVTHGQVLFWIGGAKHWPNWTNNYVADLSGEEYLHSFIGFSLFPSGTENQPGTTIIAFGSYAIVSEKASGRYHQDAACALLAKTLTPEINTFTAVASQRAGVLKSQARYVEYTRHPLLSDLQYMIDYGQPEPSHPLYDTYFNILWEFMLIAENGEMLPAEAASAAIEALQREVGDDLIVE